MLFHWETDVWDIGEKSNIHRNQHEINMIYHQMIISIAFLFIKYWICSIDKSLKYWRKFLFLPMPAPDSGGAETNAGRLNLGLASDSRICVSIKRIRVLKSDSEISALYENHIFQCIDTIFCVEFRRIPLKFHTKYRAVTLKDVDFIHSWFKSSSI